MAAILKTFYHSKHIIFEFELLKAAASVQIFHLLTLVDMFGEECKATLIEFLGWLLLFFHDLGAVSGQMDRFM